MNTPTKLEAVRIALNLNQAEFAKKLNVEPGTYSGMKNKTPDELSKKVIFKLENELNINHEYLFSNSEEMFNNTESPNKLFNNSTIENMTIETLNRMLSIIEKQQDDIRIANLNVKQA